MTLARARDTYWLGNNYQPMGKLYDSGFLSVSRLTWAMNNAYSPNIRAAASVLLAQKNASLVRNIEKGVIPTNLDEARVVKWPFNLGSKKGKSFGELVDNHELSKKDLAYAIDNAYQEQVRQAAHIILSSILNIETDRMRESRGAPKVYTNRSFMEKEREYISMKKGAWLGALLFFCVVLVVGTFIYEMRYFSIDSVIGFFQRSPLVIAVSIGIIILVASVFCAAFIFIINHTLLKLLEKKIDSYDRQISLHRKGEEGELRVVNAFRESLDGDSSVFCNLVLPGRKDDIDAVLVSPQGVFAFEVKNYDGTYENNGDDWLYKNAKNKTRKLAKSPSVQVKKNAAFLSDFLAPDFNANAQKKWVVPMIILANPDIVCYESKSSVEIWRIKHLSEELGNMPRERRISEKAQAEICARLRKFYNEENAE